MTTTATTNSKPTELTDSLPASINKDGKDFHLVILRRKLDDWWIFKYERADGSGRIWDYTESPSFVMAQIAIESKIKALANNKGEFI